MKLLFRYDPEKDLENFLKSAHAVNSNKPTKLQRLYLEKYGAQPGVEHGAVFIAEYLSVNNIDPAEKLRTIQNDWRAIEHEIFARIEKLFGSAYPTDNITVYLSTNSRCTYNIEGG